jgi:hypothetical protein
MSGVKNGRPGHPVSVCDRSGFPAKKRSPAAEIRQELGQHLFGRNKRRPFRGEIEGGDALMVWIVRIEKSNPVKGIDENRLR